MDLEIPELKQIMTEISEMKMMIQKNDSEQKPLPEWLNDRQCWELKGGMAFNTYRTKRYYQCKGGIPDAYVGGRKVWNKQSVMEWLSIPDSDLEEYHKKYKTGAKK